MLGAKKKTRAKQREDREIDVFMKSIETKSIKNSAPNKYTIKKQNKDFASIHKEVNSIHGGSQLRNHGTLGSGGGEINVNDAKAISLKAPSHEIIKGVSVPVTVSQDSVTIEKRRVIEGRKRMPGIINTKSDTSIAICSNAGINSLDDIENGLSILNTQVFADISDFIFRWNDKFSEYEGSLIRIKEQYDKAFSTCVPTGSNAKYKEAKTLFNVIQKVFNKLDVPNYSVSIKSRKVDIDIVLDEIIADIVSDPDVSAALYLEFGSNVNIEDISNSAINNYGSREFLSFILRSALDDIMKEAGIRQAYKDLDGGVYLSALKYGTAFSYIENDKSDIGFKIRSLPISNVAFDENVKSIRGNIKSNNARRCFIFFDYASIDDAIYDFPEYEDILRDDCGWGEFPFDVVESKDTWYSNKSRKKGQIGMYIDIDKKVFMVIAGSDATLLDIKDGARFPFMLDKVPYLPVYITSLFNNEDWILKYGLGHFASQLNNIDSITGNAAVKAFLQDNLGIDILTIKEGNKQNILRDLKQANIDSQIGGGRGVIISEVSAIDSTRDIYDVRPLSSSNQWGMDKKGYIDTWNNSDVIGVGVNMQDVNNNPYKTSTSINAESIASEAIIQTIESSNSEEWRFLINVVLKKINSIDDDYPINTEHFDTSNKEVAAIMQPKMKHVKMILKALKVSVDMKLDDDIRSKDLVKLRNLQSIIPSISPGSLASMKVSKEIASISGIHLSDSDFLPPQQPQVPQQQMPQGAQQMAEQLPII